MPQARDAHTQQSGSPWSLKRIARLLMALGVLTALFTQVSFGEVAATVAGARPVPLLAALGLTLISQWGMAWRLRLLTDAHGIKLTTLQLLEINLVAQFYGLFLPGGSFMVLALRFFKLARAQQDAAAAGTSLLIDRILATLALCFVGATFWLLERPRGSIFVVSAMAAVFIATLALAHVMLARKPSQIVRKVRDLTGSLAFGKLVKVDAAIANLRSLSARAFAVAISTSVAIHLIGIIVFYLTAAAVGVAPSFVSLGWIRSAMILVTMLPISIAGLGVREAASLVLLAPYDVSGEQAVAFSLLVFSITGLFPGLLGGVVGASRFISGPVSRPE